jgi:hypothetical protein
MKTGQTNNGELAVKSEEVNGDSEGFMKTSTEHAKNKSSGSTPVAYPRKDSSEVINTRDINISSPRHVDGGISDIPLTQAQTPSS